MAILKIYSCLKTTFMCWKYLQKNYFGFEMRSMNSGSFEIGLMKVHSFSSFRNYPVKKKHCKSPQVEYLGNV